MKILLSGALGHMGRAVEEALRDTEFTISAGIDPGPVTTAPFPVFAGIAPDLPPADMAVDFSCPALLTELLPYATAHQLPLILCTTGYDDAQLQSIREAAHHIPLFQASNISLGIALLKRLAQLAQAFLPDADIEIIETHHRRKADAPSGTAITLYEALSEGQAHPAVYGRHGRDSRRQPGEIGLHAVRGGTVTGEHEILFLSEGERISLRHTMETRAALAQSILPILRFMAVQQPGYYTMDHLVSQMTAGAAVST